MPSVGLRKQPNMGNFSKDPMYEYAAAFCETHLIPHYHCSFFCLDSS